MNLASLLPSLPWTRALPATRAVVPSRADAQEAEWIREAQGGSPDDFARLVDRYGDLVYECVLRIVRSPETAEEVAQDAFVKAWRALPDFRGDSRFSTWLYTIATRRALDVLRTQQRRGEHETVVEPEILEATVDESAGPAGAEKRRLERVLAKLDPLRRAVVTLYYLRDLSVGEISNSLDLPEGTVKTHLHRARRELRRAWERETAREARRGLPEL